MCSIPFYGSLRIPEYFKKVKQPSRLLLLSWEDVVWDSKANLLVQSTSKQMVSASRGITMGSFLSSKGMVQFLVALYPEIS